MDYNGLLPNKDGQPSAQYASGEALVQNAIHATATKIAAQAAAERIACRILVIEDDVPLARLLCSWLQTEGYAGEAAHCGEEALKKIGAGTYHLVLLDLNLPGMDGLTLLSKMHAEQPQLPVLVVTGRSRMEDTVMSLNGGADDCIAKPFSLVELLARIRALLRRRAVVLEEARHKPQPGLRLNREEYKVERGSRRIELSPREFALLEFLMEHAPKPVSRATLMEQVWRVPFDPNTNIVDVYMKYLRDKIDLEGEEKLIRTVRGVGYALACA